MNLVRTYYVPFLQVATKESEFGIGQPQIDIRDIGVVLHLPWMYVYDFHITAIKPREIASYDTLIYPFDLGCWLCLSGAVCAIFITITIMQKLWSIASAKRKANDYLYQGNTWRDPILMQPYSNVRICDLQISSCLQSFWLVRACLNSVFSEKGLSPESCCSSCGSCLQISCSGATCQYSFLHLWQ